MVTLTYICRIKKWFNACYSVALGLGIWGEVGTFLFIPRKLAVANRFDSQFSCVSLQSFYIQIAE